MPVQFVATPREGLNRALAAARQGQAVLYIRNTIADAIESYRAISRGVRAMLFLARFASSERGKASSRLYFKYLSRNAPILRRLRISN